MSKLTWVAVNGVKPDLPDACKVHKIVQPKRGGIWQTTNPVLSGDVTWENVIAYALEPVDPVRELVDAAKAVASPSSFSANQVTRLRAAIEAVEDMG